MQFLQYLWAILKRVATRFVNDRFTYSASALTFTTLLALVPLVTVSISIMSIFPVSHVMGHKVQAFVFHNFIPEAGSVVQQYLADFVQRTKQLSVLGTVLLVITALMMMLTIERTFNEIWHISKERRGLSAWLRYWVVLSLVPIFISLSMVATTYVVSLPFVQGTAATFGLKKALVSGVPFILTVFAFTLLYMVIPNCKVLFRHAFTGALMAALVWQIVKKAFVFYIVSFKTYHMIYGAVAVIPIFLLWIYFLWVLILFGALISHVLSTSCFGCGRYKIDHFTHAFRWLGCLWKAHQEGKSLTVKQLYRMAPGNYAMEAGPMLELLQKHHLVRRTSHFKYFLSRDLSHFTLAEFYDALPWKLPIDGKYRELPKQVQQLLMKANQSVQKLFDVSLGDLYGDFYAEKK